MVADVYAIMWILSHKYDKLCWRQNNNARELESQGPRTLAVSAANPNNQPPRRGIRWGSLHSPPTYQITTPIIMDVPYLHSWLYEPGPIKSLQRVKSKTALSGRTRQYFWSDDIGKRWGSLTHHQPTGVAKHILSSLTPPPTPATTFQISSFPNIHTS
jgi:hypothetical protein